MQYHTARVFRNPCVRRCLSALAVSNRMARDTPPNCPSFDQQLRQRRVFVRTHLDEDRVVIVLEFGGNSASGAKRIPRVFNFNRLKSEELGRTLERMAQNLTAKTIAKVKRKKLKSQESTGSAENITILPIVEPDEQIKAVLKSGKGEIPTETQNGVAWCEASHLCLDEEEYQVSLNAPLISSGKITKRLLPDFPADAELDFQLANEEESVFIWLKQKVGRGSAEPYPEEYLTTPSGAQLSVAVVMTNVEALLPRPAQNWQILSTDRCWTPSDADVGLFVALLCFPIKGDVIGEPFVAVAKNPVDLPIPKPIPFLRRQEYCKERTGKDKFRFVSYNLLADLYADQESSLRDLFPYCPPDIIKSEYRRQLTLREILGYNTDILCVQEMDTKLFNNYYSKQLGRKGYEGLLRQKQGKAHEGVGTFFRRDKFRLIKRHDIDLSTSLFNDAAHSTLAEVINNKAKLKEVLAERTTPLQVSVLETLELPTRSLIVGNTHLWFRPQFPHIRLIQMAVILKHLEHVVKELRCQDLEPGLILCGDFNSSTGWGVHRYLNSGAIPVDFPEWNMFCAEAEEYIQHALEHPFHLYSACGELKYTNYVAGFKAAIDWIYADSTILETTSVIPMPTEEELSRFTAIPSAVFPSDHIAIGCDFQWKKGN